MVEPDASSWPYIDSGRTAAMAVRPEIWKNR
jgi:hypothetical protein